MLTKIFPIRILQIAGSILAMLGVGLCSLATENWHVLFLFGIVNGKVAVILSIAVSKLEDLLPDTRTKK